MASLLFSRRMMFTLCIIAIIWLSLVVGRAQASPIPQVWSVVFDTANTDTTTVRFVVTFSEAVTGVDSSDFSLSGDVGTATIQQVQARDDAVYLITIANAHASRGLMLAVLDDDSIRNVAGIALGGQGVSNGSMVSTAVVIRDPVTTIGPVATQPAVATSAIDTVTTPLLASPQLGGIDIGYFSSLKLTKPANLPVISYYDNTNKDLKLSICNDVICSAPIIRTIDSTGDVGSHSALALTNTNMPVISYLDYGLGKLKLAICNNPACTAPILRTIDSQGGNTGYHSAITLTSTNVPVISYFDMGAKQLKLAVCNAPNCTSATIRTFPNSDVNSIYNSIALTNNNFPVISYVHKSYSPNLMLAICTDATCTTHITRILNTGNEAIAQWKNSLKLTTSDIPVISYYKGDFVLKDLVLVVCVDATCSDQYPHVTVDANLAVGLVGDYNSLALTTHNIPVISYYDFTNYNLKLAVCNNIQCKSPTIRTLDSSGDVGSYSSLALGSSPHPFIINPVVSYMDSTNKSLKLYSGAQLIDVHTTVDTGSPHVFGKSSPANNAINQPQAAILQWAPSQYATTYQYCIATSIATCTSWNTVSASTTQIYLALSGLSKNTTYYWQVRAVNGAGTTISSGGYWKFTTVK